MFRHIWQQSRTQALFVMALVVVIAGSLTLSIATARPNSAAARSALIPIIAALQQAPPPQPAPLSAGEPATPAERSAAERAVVGYLGAIKAREWEVAWGFTHPDSRGDIEMDEWSLPQIARSLEDSEYASEWLYGLRYSLPTILMGADLELGEIVTWEMEGWANLSVRFEVPATLMLRRLGDDWAIDLEATRQLEARQAIERQLEPLRQQPGSSSEWLRAMMMMDGPVMGAMSLTDLALGEYVTGEFGVGEVSVADDRAHVQVVGTATMHLALPLANGDRGWSIAWCREPVLLGPDDTFAEVVAGRLRGAATTQACQSNMKQLALAMLMYAQDYDERFPPADRWCAATYPYTRNREIHHCPADDAAFSYAYNYKLSRRMLAEVADPSLTIMLYESEIGKGDAFDWPQFPGASLPVPGRHEEANNYAYVDGHVRLDAPWSCMVQEDAYRLQPTRASEGAMLEGEPGGPPPEPPCEE